MQSQTILTVAADCIENMDVSELNTGGDADG